MPNAFGKYPLEISMPENEFDGDGNYKFCAYENQKNQTIEIDPARCRPWKYHNRDIAWLNNVRCKDLIHSIKQNGQIEPVLVRRVHNCGEYDYELIYGVRRWFAISTISNAKLLAKLTEADDKTCMILMHSENADSKDISDFERAFSFAEQMKSEVFCNQTELAQAMGVTQSTISKMIKAAQIFEHEWIQNLFENKLEIPIKLAYALAILLKNTITYEKIKREALAVQSEIAKTGFIKPSHTLSRLITVAKPDNYIDPNSVILRVDNKPAIYCHLNKFGKFSIVFENEVKTLNRDEVEMACLEALKDYVFKPNIPGE